MAALLLLAAAFARPYLRAATPGPLRLVAIDRLYSMGGPGVFAAALDRAREAVAAAPRGERVAVIAFDDRADVLAPPEGQPMLALRSTVLLRALARRDTNRSFSRQQNSLAVVPENSSSSPICKGQGGTVSQRRISPQAGHSMSSTCLRDGV